MKSQPKLSATKRTAIIAAAGLILTATGVYVTRHQLESRWQLHAMAKVIDGDTIKVDDNVSVRLIGIDSPEVGKCFYDESKQAVTQFLTGRSVYLEKEISGVDRYGRLLRYAFLPAAGEQHDNLLVNDYIVRQGWAQADQIPPDNRYRDLFNSAQEEAIRNNRGMWAKCDYEDQLSERREHSDPPPDPSYMVKGNISTRGYGKTYLVPGCDNYNNVKIDFSKGEQYFKTVKSAEKSGYRRATNCP
ncbi:MAG: hypothetical protein A3J07_02340 [Candidatus Doudnabacteria bacterium RIFCSPLOWO2_02_FULL_49_13]|uniref:TNase-like domain-containing protein n=1 Tax=Candidatus Doudnabacteria bacterium RIFCSPHIGHO2_12_FULL_48_16 TaxID=1817838 RepID=A0A1F5PM63_9BACT|nr:MAG: hypothetical protein A3B77_00375 [Candidatus Doudnabacteria bacterium RIFCSPHIGHO2_02_FULL_49_24]OGE89500.1 MAG: hypothetical protein A2760_02620 [Candidatus Doudnabacteria bacterium RIFCSPHIGHO2_01_FULL_50_67]OGE90770.1 MAG: hypothetical protein A3E29_01440 [Candidatus Doudnabacteria bacterium RIFCSPHIGHO2_12_FULL_48_16]OGE97402.1 MAG: hypothetical protein A2990_01255 [Candidatus Doudnabacteria bacterium RIFCSPLOWO2_01_FULL_49_40]OGF02632.1 MAG: hypothetical protein A3J07_02340 [Candid